jgi:CRP-like cAMP-binding protein
VGVCRRLERAIERITLDYGQVLLDEGEKPVWAYFPENAVVSVVRILGDGSMIEVGLIGCDGFVGIHSLTEYDDEQPYRHIVQNSGDTFRLPLKDLRAELSRGEEFQNLLLRFTAAFLTQISQTAACNRLHTIEQRLARWLLMMRDRVSSDEMKLTQEFLSHMLGTRVAGVNEALRALTLSALVSHRRNNITIVDREGLEAAACECYAFLKLRAR